MKKLIERLGRSLLGLPEQLRQLPLRVWFRRILNGPHFLAPYRAIARPRIPYSAEAGQQGVDS